MNSFAFTFSDLSAGFFSSTAFEDWKRGSLSEFASSSNLTLLPNKSVTLAEVTFRNAWVW
jgi:hypothetical protein